MENCLLEENYRTEILCHLKSEKESLPGRSNGVKKKNGPAKACVAEVQKGKCEEQGQKLQATTGANHSEHRMAASASLRDNKVLPSVVCHLPFSLCRVTVKPSGEPDGSNRHPSGMGDSDLSENVKRRNSEEELSLNILKLW